MNQANGTNKWDNGNFGACGSSYFTNKCHLGNDILADRGTTVHSIAAGNIIYQSSTQDTSNNCLASGWGYDYSDASHNLPGTDTCNMALLVQYYDDQGTPFIVLYGHLQYSTKLRVTTGPVSPPVKVLPGEVLGIIGRWGNTDKTNKFLDHLHFGLRPGISVPNAPFGMTDCPGASQAAGPTLPTTKCGSNGANGFVQPGTYLNTPGRKWTTPPGIDATQGYLGLGYSESFFEAWQRALVIDSNGAFTKSLGAAFDNGGTADVHQVRGVFVQDFLNPSTATRYGTDGQTAIVYNGNYTDILGNRGKAFSVREGFWGAYKCLQPSGDTAVLGGIALLGAPTSDEIKNVYVNDTCNAYTPEASSTTSIQFFDNGCMWWRGLPNDNSIHVHLSSGATGWSMPCSGFTVTNNPPGPGWTTNYLLKDGIGFGWEDWSWGSTRTLNSTEKIYGGINAAKVVFNAWGGLYIATEGNTYVSSSTYLRFAVHGGTTGGQHPVVQLYDVPGNVIGQKNLLPYVPGGVIAANTWYSVDIPLTDLGLTGNIIGGVAIQSDVAGTMYFDEIRLQDMWISAPTYGDALATGWEDWSWGSTRTFGSTEKPYLGTTSVKVAFQAWGGFYLWNPSQVAAGSLTRLRFAVNGGPTGGQHPTVQLYGFDESMIGELNLLPYVPGGALAANTWYNVDIPLTAFGSIGTTIGGFAVMSDIAGTMYFDEIRFQDVRYGSPVYSNGIGSGWQLVYSNVTPVNVQDKAYLGASSLKVTYPSANADLSFRSTAQLYLGYSAKLRFAIYSGAGGQHPLLSLYNVNGVMIGNDSLLHYVPGETLAPNTWYYVEVPLMYMTSSVTSVASFTIRSDVATTIWLDEVRLE